MRLAACIALLLVALSASPVAGKKSKPAPAATKAAIEAVLDGRGEAVAECIQDKAASQGLARAEVQAHVLINGRGQIFECKVTAQTDRGPSPALAACVEKVLRAAPYPSSAAPLVSVDRTWRYGK